jgi:hypothetical protein
MIIAIDPGVNASAFAWGAKTLEGVGTAWPPCASVGASVVCEMPVFRGKHAKDIADLAVAVGVLKEQARARGYVWRTLTPETWKKQEKKPHQHRRLWQTLSRAERLVLCRAMGRTQDEVGMYIVKACEALALGRKPAYSRGKAVKDNDLLDAAALWAVVTGRMK